MSLSQVHYAFGDVKSGSVRTGKYSSSGATFYSSGGGYRTGTGKPAGKVTGSRVIYEDNPTGYGTVATQRVTTYLDGTVVYTDIKTGESTTYKTDPGVKPGQISIEEKNVKSYEEQMRKEARLKAKKEADRREKERLDARQERREDIQQQATQFDRPMQTGLVNFPTLDKTSNGFEQRLSDLAEREQRLEEFTTLGGRLSPDKSKSPWGLGEIGKTVARVPLNIAAMPTLIGGRIGLFSETAYKGKWEELFGKQTRKDLTSSLAASYDPKTPEGLINIGLTAVGIKSVAAARQVQVATPKVPPDVVGRTSFGIKQTATVQKTPLIRQASDIKVTQRGQVPQTVYQTEIPQQTVTTIRGAPGQKFDVGGLTFPSGKQYTTISRDYYGVPYRTQLVREPSGMTITKVFRADKLISKKVTQTKPDIVFTEKLPQIKTTDIIKGYDKRLDVSRGVGTQEGVSLVTKGKTEPTGKIITRKEDVLVAKTATPREKIFVGDDTISIEVGRTKYDFVDYPVKPKPLIMRELDSGIETIKPATTGVLQKQKLDQIYEVRYGPRTKRPKPEIPKEPKQLSPEKLQDLWLDQYMKQLPSQTRAVPKQPKPTVTAKKITETVKVQRPKPVKAKTSPVQISNVRGTTVTTTVVPRAARVLPFSTSSKALYGTKLLVTPKPDTKIVPKVLTETKPMINTVQTGIPKTTARPSVRTTGKTFQLSRKKLQQRKLRQKQVTKQVTKVRTGLSKSVYTPNITSYRYTQPLIITPPPVIPAFGPGKPLKPKKKKKKQGIGTLYRPSLKAVDIGIKGRRPSYLTGLRVRPIT